MDSLIPILIITLLILLNGLFVAAEFAIIGAPRATIRRRAEKGQRVARIVNRMLHIPRLQDRYIATAQLGITFASLGLGMYGEHILAEWLAELLESLGASRWIAAHTLASVLAITILTYFHIVVGEMVPKSLALQHAGDTVLWITPPMLWIQTAMYPLVIGLNGIGNGVLRLLGIRREFAAGHFHTPEELQFVIQESQEGGLLRPEAGQVLRDLFDFGELTASDVMVPRVKVTGVPLEATPLELKEILRTSRHTRYPIYTDHLDRVVGMVHIKDLLRLLLRGRPLTRAEVRPVPYVPATASLDAVLGAMRRERTQMVVVMDEHGGMAGVLTIEDIFEEVIGDIEEEAPLRDLYLDADQRLHAAGTVRLEEVGERLGLSLEREDVDTVSGLILTLLGRPATVGDMVEFGGVRFEVAEVEGHGVSKCLVTPLPEPSGPGIPQGEGA